LDDTLWSGIVGEIGVDEIGWTLAERAQIHGLYQQQLRALAEMGALLGVASKNDPDVAKTALARTDLLIGTDALFPVEANWKPKSQSVERILNAWNIHADSVVFVDDSPMEVAEVQEAFPGMTCLRFPKENATDALAMLRRLRDLFGKPTLSDEDRLRSDSIKANALMSMARDESDSNDFVANLNGQVAFGRSKNGKNRRLLELINKTNQFNLNGVRIEDTDWMRHLSDPSSFVVSAAYQDKFGPLGIVGVAAGKKDGDQLLVTSWVMSCRAFSRKIEFHMADYLLRSVGAGTLSLAFEQTERNQPLQEFLDELNGVADEHGIVRLTSQHLAGACAELPHEVVEIRDE
jgi:FkbH-like protein